MNDQQDIQDRSSMDIQNAFAILRRHKTFIVVFFFSATLCSLALTYVVSEKYLAATTIFYHPIESSLLRQRETESFGAPAPVSPYRAIYQTLRDAVRNEAVLRPVVEKLGLDQEIHIEYRTGYARWYHETKRFVKTKLIELGQLAKHGRVIQEDRKAAAIEHLRNNIDIVAARDSYIYILKVKDKFPARASQIVDLTADFMVKWFIEQRQQTLNERASQLRQSVTDKENKIEELQVLRQTILDENNLVSINEETVKALANLYQLELDAVRINSRIQRKQVEMAEYERLIPADTNSYIQSDDIKGLRTQEFFGEIELQGLQAEKRFLEGSIKELKEQLSILPSQHEKTIALTNLYQMKLDEIRISAQMQKKEKEIAEYRQRTPEGSISYLQSDNIRDLRTNKLFGDIELKELLAEKDYLENSIRELKQRLAKLPLLQKQLNMLDLYIVSAMREHEHLQDMYTEAIPQVQMPQSETRVLHQAVVPSLPIQPIKIYHVGITGVLSLFLGVGLAFMMDFYGLGISEAAGRKKRAQQVLHASNRFVLSGELRRTRQLFKEFAERLEADGGSMFLCKTNSLVLAQSIDPGHTPFTIPLPLKKDSIFDRALTRKESLLARDIGNGTGVKPSGWSGYKNRSCLVYPLVNHHGRVSCLISLHNKRTGEFTETDRDLGTQLLVSHFAAEKPGDSSRRLSYLFHHAMPSTMVIGITVLCAVVFAGGLFYMLLKSGF